MENTTVKVKGEYNGLCNRTACQSPNEVVYFNHSTEKYYCPSCAKKINEYNRADAMRLFGHDLCMIEERPEIVDEVPPIIKSHLEIAMDRVRREISIAPKPYIRDEKIGRNDPCPCGSVIKYKKCCGQ